MSKHHDGLPLLPPAEAAKAADRLRIQVIGVRAGWSAWAAREAEHAGDEGGRDASDKRWGELMAVDACLRNAEIQLEQAIERITREAGDPR